MSVLQDFLLFEFSDWKKYGDMILNVCSYAIVPVFIFSLFIDKFSIRPDPMGIFKRMLTAQALILLIPVYFSSVAGFGFEVGDSILKTQKTGLIANWNTFKKRAQIEAKKNKEEADFLTTVTSFFSFDGSDVAEKFAAIVIFVCMLLVKIIYSIVYYFTYCSSGILALFSIIPVFSSYLTGVLKSVLYLIVTAVLVAFVLAFLNDVLNFTVSENGFLESLEVIAKFLVLCFVLLGCLKIGHSLVNGKGAEVWGASVGQNLATAVPLLGMSLAKSFGKEKVSQGVSSSSAMGMFAASGGIAAGRSLITKSLSTAANPLLTTGSILKNNAKDSLGQKMSSIQEKNGLGSIESLNSSNKNSSQSAMSENQNYSSLFSNVAGSNGRVSSMQAINPINHVKTSALSMKNSGQRFSGSVKDKLGLPANSKDLSLREKSVFVSSKLMGAKPLSKEEVLKNQIIANKITKAMEEKK